MLPDDHSRDDESLSPGISHVRRWLSGESRLSFYSTVFGVWLMVAIYAIVHDQYLVRIASHRSILLSITLIRIEFRMLQCWPYLLLFNHQCHRV